MFLEQQQSLWQKRKLSPEQTQQIQNLIIAKGRFQKKSKLLKRTLLRYYYLVGSFLLYSERDDIKDIKGIVDLTFMYAEFDNNIVLFNGSELLELQCESTLQRKEWEENFRSVCILNNFQREFEVLDPIKQNKTSTIYQCLRKTDREIYAVKIIKKKSLTPESEQALKNEILCLRRVNNHNSVLSLKFVYESEAEVMLITEFLNGGEITEQNNLNDNQTRRTMRNLLKGLVYIHNNGVMHRDIKPQNILYRSEFDYNDPVIINFGQSCLIDDQFNTVQKCGTAGYVAPEMLNYFDRKNKYNEKCDVFSLGITFFFMLFGFNPFLTSDKKMTIMRNKNAFIEFPLDLTIDKQMVSLLSGMLAKNPKERLSAQESIDHPFFKSKCFDQIDFQNQFHFLTKQTELKLSNQRAFTKRKRSYSPQQQHDSMIENQMIVMTRSRKSTNQLLKYQMVLCETEETSTQDFRQQIKEIRIRQTSFQKYRG